MNFELGLTQFKIHNPYDRGRKPMLHTAQAKRPDNSKLKIQNSELSEMVARACPVCASTDASHVYAEANFNVAKLDEYAFASRKMPEYMHHRLIECPTCDLVYA